MECDEHGNHHFDGRYWVRHSGSSTEIYCGEEERVSTLENPVNFKLISHPLNWFVVIITLIIAGTAGTFVMALAGKHAATSSIDPNLGVGQSNIGIQS